MYCKCRDEFDWMMKMIEKGDCFNSWEDISKFIDSSLLNLRYMKKRFGYLFYDEHKYIKKINGRNAIFVNKEHQFVCRKPDQPTYHGIDEEGKTINVTIPMKDKERYDIKYLDEIDRGDPFITSDEKYQNEYVKNTKNILKKIKLVKPEIFNSNEFFEVLDSEDFDNIKLEKDRKKFYKQVKEFVLDEIELEEDIKNFYKQVDEIEIKEYIKKI